jgi:5'-methylthioadenosine phosphorylase
MQTLGVIGGSGLYGMADLADVEDVRVSTPFGDPSDDVISGRLGDVRLLFLPRHGRGHHTPPHRINYRANLWALKELGAEQVVSVSAVGSMKEHLHPGDVVLPDQFFDRTRHRPNTFFEDDGVVVHVSLADPIDSALQQALYRAAVDLGARCHRGGTYLCIDGPQFSTRAESRIFRSWGVDVIGMTNLPEARLAREAELPYATIALVTDYDCWHETEDDVTVDNVLAVLKKNVETAQAIIRTVSKNLPDPAKSPASSALAAALITDKKRISPAARERLGLLIDKYLQ